jgi:hypothetical protein
MEALAIPNVYFERNSITWLMTPMSFFFFFIDPGFWRLQDKIGMALDDIHITGHVPQCESHTALFGFFFPFHFIFVFVFRFAVSVCGFWLGRSISTASVPSWRHRHTLLLVRDPKLVFPPSPSLSPCSI